jgi:hypothetical protein
MQLSDLQRVVREVRVLAYVSTGMTVLLAILLAVSTILKDRTLERATRERPIAVIPGAVAGEYIAGLSETNLTLASRYLIGLATNITPANVDERLRELQAHADPTYLPRLAIAADQLRAEVRSQAQSRVMTLESNAESLTRSGEDFVYQGRGPRTFFSGGLVMMQDTAQATLRFRLGSPSERNRMGIWIVDLAIAPAERPGSGATRRAAP